MKALKLFLAAALAAPPAFAANTKEGKDSCPLGDKAATVAAPVNFPALMKEVYAVREQGGQALVNNPNPVLERELKSLFERNGEQVSKMEQFYGLLHALAQHRRNPQQKNLHFSEEQARRLLLASRVFSTPEIPLHVKGVHLEWDPNFEKARWRVDFDQAKVSVPLNSGKGFGVFREGLCQLAKELIFYGWFAFATHKNKRGNVEVDNFENVDLYGQFGSRGVVDVDINYVSLRAVEFLKGSNLGTVRAKVSRKEFEVNKHSWLLRTVTRLVTDRSTQPIDW